MNWYAYIMWILNLNRSLQCQYFFFPKFKVQISNKVTPYYPPSCSWSFEMWRVYYKWAMTERHWRSHSYRSYFISHSYPICFFLKKKKSLILRRAAAKVRPPACSIHFCHKNEPSAHTLLYPHLPGECQTLLTYHEKQHKSARPHMSSVLGLH